MKVDVIVKYSTFRKYLEDKSFDAVEVPEGATARDLVPLIELPEYYFNQVTINDYEKPPDTVLTDGDRVGIWPPRIGGG